MHDLYYEALNQKGDETLWVMQVPDLARIVRVLLSGQITNIAQIIIPQSTEKLCPGCEKAFLTRQNKYNFLHDGIIS